MGGTFGRRRKRATDSAVVKVYATDAEYASSRLAMERDGWYVASCSDYADGSIRTVWTRHRRYKQGTNFVQGGVGEAAQLP